VPEEAANSKPVRRRQRPRNAMSIVKAAKTVGATSVTFPDGTVVSLVLAAAPSADGSATEVDRWFEANAS
jgi:hypothetical protein